eukprot:TRINITY_DN45142_c0_g1_i1.p1 TRINITY_DN45142_c0_g1~~TRINITY_DN45142_c0_g1_i1.p1  ORF type:complete len:749 (+),score=153.94 TRINITY_DN45142_c0_g1_i1:83-2248(+)
MACEKWTAVEVADWLQQLGLSKDCRRQATENGIDGVVLASLKEDDLAEALGLSAPADRARVLGALRDLSRGGAPAAAGPAVWSSPASPAGGDSVQPSASGTRTTHIVVSVGGACWQQETVAGCVANGCDILRINASHRRPGDFEALLPRLHALKARSPHLALLGDLQGPKIRTTRVATGHTVLAKGSTLVLRIASGPDDLCTSGQITLADTPEQAALVQALGPGCGVVIGDGAIVLQVLRREPKGGVTCETVRGGRLDGRKGVNVPGLALPCSALTAKDKADLEFFMQASLDWVALSFVQRVSDVEDLEAAMRASGVPKESWPRVMLKIEKPLALDNIDELLDRVDGIMVARGDLGVEIGLENVPLAQKMMLARAREKGKYSVVATQALMGVLSETGCPTRADCSDVVNAVQDGCDGVMLSDEVTQNMAPGGPENAVRWLHRLLRTADGTLRPKGAKLGPAAASAAVEKWNTGCIDVRGVAHTGLAVDDLDHNKSCGASIDVGSPKGDAPELPPAAEGQLWVLVSGKRGAGKDWLGAHIRDFAAKLCRRTGGAAVARLADPVKRLFCERNGLDAGRLSSTLPEDRDYKEKHRQALTQFYQENRPSLHWLCSTLVSDAASAEPAPAVVIVTDVRHPGEIRWFQTHMARVVTVRVDASETTRVGRGVVLDPAKDEHVTETALDDYGAWDLRYDNEPVPDEQARLRAWLNEQLMTLLVRKARLR